MNTNQSLTVKKMIENIDEMWQVHLREVKNQGREAQRQNLIGNILGTLPTWVRRGWMTENEAFIVLGHVNSKLDRAGFKLVTWDELIRPEGSIDRER